MSAVSAWRPVDARVDAKVGPALIRLMPYTTSTDPDIDPAPWAVVGMVRVTFRFGGDLVVTKRLRASHRWLTAGGWAKFERPSPAAVAEAVDAVSDALRDLVHRHGIDTAGIEVVTTIPADGAR